jgi:hypothetical protein
MQLDAAVDADFDAMDIFSLYFLIQSWEDLTDEEMLAHDSLFMACWRNCQSNDGAGQLELLKITISAERELNRRAAEGTN